MYYSLHLVIKYSIFWIKNYKIILQNSKRNISHM